MKVCTDLKEEYSVLVSVIMPTHNCGQYIEEALRSIIAQTMKDWEVLIIDDFSTDNTAEVLKPYLSEYPNIRYFWLPQQRGAAAARNEGLKRARGRYIAFLDSDDVWMSEKLEKQIAFMSEKDVKFSCTAYMHMDRNGRLLKRIYVPPAQISYQKCLLLSNPIGSPTAVYDRKVLGICEVPDIKKRNDFALWLQILKRTDYCYGIQDVLAVYRTGRYRSLSHPRSKLASYHWQLYRKIEGHSIVRSAFEMGCWVFVKGLGIGRGKRTRK